MLLFQVTYKALEQFSESDFDLEKLEKTVFVTTCFVIIQLVKKCKLTEFQAKRTRQSRNLDSLVLVNTIHPFLREGVKKRPFNGHADKEFNKRREEN